MPAVFAAAIIGINRARLSSIEQLILALLKASDAAPKIAISSAEAFFAALKTPSYSGSMPYSLCPARGSVQPSTARHQKAAAPILPETKLVTSILDSLHSDSAFTKAILSAVAIRRGLILQPIPWTHFKHSDPLAHLSLHRLLPISNAGTPILPAYAQERKPISAIIHDKPKIQIVLKAATRHKARREKNRVIR